MSSESDPPSLLVVDDDNVLRQRLVKAFNDRGYLARGASNVAAALELARADPPEYAVVDLRMPDGSGLDLLRELKAIDPGTAVVMLTGYGSIPTAIDAIRLGAVYFLNKPADVDEILAAFSRSDQPGSSETTQSFEAVSLARAEWEHIQRVMADCDNNVSEAARRLKLHRRSLQRKLQKRPPSE